MKHAIRVLLVGGAAGTVAGQVMDKATTWFYERQSEESKRRETEVQAEGALMAAARKLTGLIGAEPTDEQVGRLAQAMHQSLGQVYGVAAAALVRRGVSPLKAGVATGLAGFLLVDELVNSLFFTPPPQSYPVESHLRGAVGHLTFGATAGVLLAAARRLRLV